jgi:hypothetical protein
MNPNPTVTVSAADLLAWLAYTEDARCEPVEALYARLSVAVERQAPAIAEHRRKLVAEAEGRPGRYRCLEGDA